ncbi:MAG: family peptidase [Microbacteriaceae bacterium]|jgi:murein DD-endopeptidase MepM/ murein hydrolase activator NlpD|nr:family peptidase [Microbacteriaceae bacterium]
MPARPRTNDPCRGPIGVSEFNWDLKATDTAADGSARPSNDAFPTRRQLRERASQAAKSSGPVPRALRHATPTTVAVAAKRAKRPLLPKIVSISAMLGAGALLVATSLPAVALHASAADASTAGLPAHSKVQGQSLAVSDSIAETAPVRDAYTVVNIAAQARMKNANQSFLYTNDINGTIQWPFPDPVPVSSGFGARHVANCSFCSTFHEGVDFVPPAGTTIDSIAAGVVSQAGTTGPFGNHVMIDHVINGQKVQSLYAHMISGSIKVVVGQQVTVAQPLGLLGSTGNATGPHLHLEIHLDGTPVDPFAWLKANAN